MVKQQENDPTVGNSLLRTATTRRLGQSKLALTALRSGHKPPVRRIKVDKEKSSDESRFSDLTGSIGHGGGGPFIRETASERDVDSLALSRSTNNSKSIVSTSHKPLGSAVKTNIQPKAFTLPAFQPKNVKKTNMQIHKGISISAPSPMTLDRVQVQMSQEHAVPESKEYKEHKERIQQMQQEEKDKNEVKEKKKQLNNTLKEKVVKERGQGFEAQLGDFKLGDFSIGDLHARNDDERPPSTRSASNNNPKEKKKSLVKKLLGKIKPKSPRKKAVATSVQDDSKARAEKALSVVEARSMARKALMASKNKKNGGVDTPPLFPVVEISTIKDASTVSDLDASHRRPFPVAEIQTAYQARDDDGSVSTLGTPHVFENRRQDHRHGIEVPRKIDHDDSQGRTGLDPSVQGPRTVQLSTASPSFGQVDPIQDQDQDPETTPSQDLQVDSKCSSTEAADNGTRITGDTGAIEVVVDRGCTPGVQNGEFVMREGVPIDYALAAAACGAPQIARNMALQGATSPSNKDTDVDDMENIMDEKTLAHLDKLADDHEAESQETAAEEEQADESSPKKEDSIIVYEPTAPQAPLSPISTFAYAIEAAIRKAQAQRNGGSAVDDGHAVEEEGQTVPSEPGTGSHGYVKSDAVASEEAIGENSENIDPPADLPNSLSPIDEGEEIMVTPPLSPRSATSRRSGKAERQDRYQVPSFPSRMDSSLQSDKNVDDYLKLEESVLSSGDNTDGSEEKDDARLQSTPKKSGGFMSSLGGMFWKKEKQPPTDPQGERATDLTRTNPKSGDHDALSSTEESVQSKSQESRSMGSKEDDSVAKHTEYTNESQQSRSTKSQMDPQGEQVIDLTRINPKSGDHGAFSSAEESIQSKSQESRSMGSKEDDSAAKHTEYTDESQQSRSTESQTETNRIQLGNSKPKDSAGSKTTFLFDDFFEIAENKLGRSSHGRSITRDSSDHDDDRHSTEGGVSPRPVVVGENVDEGSVATGQIPVVQGIEIPAKSKTPSATAATPKARGAGQKKSFDFIDMTSTTSENRGSTGMRSTSLLDSKSSDNEQEETKLPDRTPGDGSLHGDSESEIIVISDSLEDNIKGSKLMSKESHNITYPQPRRSLAKDLPCDTSYEVYEDPDGEEVVCYEVNPFGLMERSPTTSPRTAGTATRAVRSQKFQEAPQNSTLFDSTDSTSLGASGESPFAAAGVDSFPPSRVASAKSKPTPGDMREGPLRTAGTAKRAVRSQEFQEAPHTSILVDSTDSTTLGASVESPFSAPVIDSFPPSRVVSIKSKPTPGDMREGPHGPGSRRSIGGSVGSVQSLSSRDISTDRNKKSSLRQAAFPTVQTKGSNGFAGYFTDGLFDLLSIDSQSVANKGALSRKQKSSDPDDTLFSESLGSSRQVDIDDNISTALSSGGPESARTRHSSEEQKLLPRLVNKERDPDVLDYVFEYSELVMCGHDPEIVGKHLSKQKQGGRADGNTHAASIAAPFPVAVSVLEKERREEIILEDDSIGGSSRAKTVPGQIPGPSLGLLCGAVPVYLLYKMNGGDGGPETVEQQIKSSARRDTADVISPSQNNEIPVTKTLLQPHKTEFENEPEESSLNEETLNENSPKKPPQLPSQKIDAGASLASHPMHLTQGIKSPQSATRRAPPTPENVSKHDRSLLSKHDPYWDTLSTIASTKGRSSTSDNKMKQTSTATPGPIPVEITMTNKSKEGSISVKPPEDDAKSDSKQVVQSMGKLNTLIGDDPSDSSLSYSLLTSDVHPNKSHGSKEFPKDQTAEEKSVSEPKNIASSSKTPPSHVLQTGNQDSRRLSRFGSASGDESINGPPSHASSVHQPTDNTKSSDSASKNSRVTSLIARFEAARGEMDEEEQDMSSARQNSLPNEEKSSDDISRNESDFSEDNSALLLTVTRSEVEEPSVESAQEGQTNSGNGKNCKLLPCDNLFQRKRNETGGPEKSACDATIIVLPLCAPQMSESPSEKPEVVPISLQEFVSQHGDIPPSRTKSSDEDVDHVDIAHPMHFPSHHDAPQTDYNLSDEENAAVTERGVMNSPEGSRTHTAHSAFCQNGNEAPPVQYTSVAMAVGAGSLPSGVVATAANSSRNGGASQRSGAMSHRSVSWGFEEVYDPPKLYDPPQLRSSPAPSLRDGTCVPPMFENSRYHNEEDVGPSESSNSPSPFRADGNGDPRNNFPVVQTSLSAGASQRSVSWGFEETYDEPVHHRRVPSPEEFEQLPGALHQAPVAASWTERKNSSESGSQHVEGSQQGAAVAGNLTPRNNNSDYGSRGGSSYLSSTRSQSPASQNSTSNTAAVGASWGQRNDSSDSGSQGGGSPHMPIARSQMHASQKSSMSNSLPVGASWAQRNNSSDSVSRGGGSPHLPTTRSQSPASRKLPMSNSSPAVGSWAERNDSSDSGSREASWAQRNDSSDSVSRGGASAHLPTTRSQSPAPRKLSMSNSSPAVGSWAERNDSSDSGSREGGSPHLPIGGSQAPAPQKSSMPNLSPVVGSWAQRSRQGCEHTYTQRTSHEQNNHEGARQSEGAVGASSHSSSVEKRAVTAAIAVAAAGAAVSSNWKTSESNSKSHSQSSTDSRKIGDEFSLSSGSTYYIGEPLETHRHIQDHPSAVEKRAVAAEMAAAAASAAVSSNWKTSESNGKSHSQSSTDSRKVGDAFSSHSDSTYSIGEPLESHRHVQDIEPEGESQEDTYDGDEQALIARTLELSKALLASMTEDDLDPEDDMVKSLLSLATNEETRLISKQGATVPHSVTFDSTKKSSTDSTEDLVQITAECFVQVAAESRGLSPKDDTSLQLTSTSQSIEGLVASGASRDYGIATNSYARASSTSPHPPVSLVLQKGSRSQTKEPGQADHTGTISRQSSDLQAIEAILESVAQVDPVIAARIRAGNASVQSSESTSHADRTGSEGKQSNGSISDVRAATTSGLPQVPISVSFQYGSQENTAKKYPRREAVEVDRVLQGRDSDSTVRDTEGTYSVSDVSHDSPMNMNALLSKYDNLAHHLIAQNGQLKIAASSGESPEQVDEGGSNNTSEVLDKLSELRAQRAKALARYQNTQVSTSSTGTPQNGGRQQNDASKDPGSQSQTKNPSLTFSSGQYGRRERDHVLNYSRDSARSERTFDQKAQRTGKSQLTSPLLTSEARRRSKSAEPVRQYAHSYERKEDDEGSSDAMSSSSDSTRTTPSTKARDLRKQLDEALHASREIRKSHENLGTELSTFKSRFYEKNNEIEFNAVKAMGQAQHR